MNSKKTCTALLLCLAMLCALSAAWAESSDIDVLLRSLSWDASKDEIITEENIAAQDVQTNTDEVLITLKQTDSFQYRGRYTFEDGKLAKYSFMITGSDVKENTTEHYLALFQKVLSHIEKETAEAIEVEASYKNIAAFQTYSGQFLPALDAEDAELYSYVEYKDASCTISFSKDDGNYTLFLYYVPLS